jgi:hypothetical protein
MRFGFRSFFCPGIEARLARREVGIDLTMIAIHPVLLDLLREILMEILPDTDRPSSKFQATSSESFHLLCAK